MGTPVLEPQIQAYPDLKPKDSNFVDDVDHESPVIYIDLDGVICAFGDHFYSLHGVRESSLPVDKDFWEVFNRKPEGFFRDLKPYYGYLVFLQFVTRMAFSHGYTVKFLSALSPYNAVSLENQAIEKNDWLKKYVWDYGFNIPAIYTETAGHKAGYAKVGDILIDDRQSNILQWRSNGGTGILHESGNFAKSMTELCAVLSLKQ